MCEGRNCRQRHSPLTNDGAICKSSCVRYIPGDVAVPASGMEAPVASIRESEFPPSMPPLSGGTGNMLVIRSEVAKRVSPVLDSMDTIMFFLTCLLDLRFGLASEVDLSGDTW